MLDLSAMAEPDGAEGASVLRGLRALLDAAGDQPGVEGLVMVGVARDAALGFAIDLRGPSSDTDVVRRIADAAEGDAEALSRRAVRQLTEAIEKGAPAGLSGLLAQNGSARAVVDRRAAQVMRTSILEVPTQPDEITSVIGTIKRAELIDNGDTLSLDVIDEVAGDGVLVHLPTGTVDLDHVRLGIRVEIGGTAQHDGTRRVIGRRFRLSPRPRGFQAVFDELDALDFSDVDVDRAAADLRALRHG